MLFITHLSFIFSWFLSFENPAKPVVTVADEISWKASRRLTWEDFKGKANAQDPLHALTATNIDMKAKCDNGELKVKIESTFAPHESWSKNKKSERLLFHEQLHFDITEIYARRLFKELTSLKNACDNSEQLNKIATRVFDEWKKQEDIYDKETNHGLDQEKMKVWADKVNAELKSLEAYADKD
ncbi:DUF922 domain-containing protein [Adhaeribacter sp. BT258]|uniref:DUF922 domain-containing protein n=1 Tax=Adhaeribacter terrigena TaxID=2793070 RepID=A0ABS1C5V2_9BACT|nr:DUF922 domain-containing protein [Adhaeribacter terrigena]MBK0404678.1 DUF922 domain-containing protein [Adhaeribacter terrigena]